MAGKSEITEESRLETLVTRNNAPEGARSRFQACRRVRRARAPGRARGCGPRYIASFSHIITLSPGIFQSGLSGGQHPGPSIFHRTRVYLRPVAPAGTRNPFPGFFSLPGLWNIYETEFPSKCGRR